MRQYNFPHLVATSPFLIPKSSRFYYETFKENFFNIIEKFFWMVSYLGIEKQRIFDYGGLEWELSSSKKILPITSNTRYIFICVHTPISIHAPSEVMWYDLSRFV